MRALPLCALLAACSFGVEYGGTAYLCPAGECPSGYSCIDGRCVTGTPSVDAAPPVSWWDTSWRARHPLSVRNLSDRDLPAGFQVGWMVNVEDDLGERSVEALRVVAYQVDSDTWREIPRVVDGAVIADQVVWFQLPAALEREQQMEVWIYLDHPDPPMSPWAATDVFELSDPLTNLSPERWVTAGAVVDDGDEVRFDDASDMRSSEPRPVDRAVDILARVSDTATRCWFGFQREVPDLAPDVPWLIWIRRLGGDQMQPEYAGLDDTEETAWQGAPVAVGSAGHVYSVERLRDRVVYRLDYRIALDDHDHPLDADHGAPLYIRFSNTGGSSFWVSRVRVRQVAYPPPELVLGAREDFAGP